MTREAGSALMTLYERDNAPIVCSVTIKVPLVWLMLLGGVFAAGCASTGAVPRPFPTPAPRESGASTRESSTADSTAPNPDSTIPNPDTAGPNPEPAHAEASARPRRSSPDRSASEGGSLTPNPGLDGYVVAGAALLLRGTPYRLGGADPEEGFDCSGLVHYVYARYGIAVPRDVRSQYRATQKIEDEDVQPGDLLFFATEGHDASHVAIAISSNQFVHAPNSTGVVRVETLKSGYWAPRYLGAHRVMDSVHQAPSTRSGQAAGSRP